jgi:hypothetical protein
MKRTILVSALVAQVAIPLVALSQDGTVRVSPRALVDSQPDGRTLLRDFQDGLITEIGFPACDGAARDAAKMTVQFAPEVVRTKRLGAAAESQRTWLPRNFRIVVEGLDVGPVSRVEPFTIKHGGPAGGRREPEGTTVVLWVPEASATPWIDWSGPGDREAQRARALSLFLADGTPARDFLLVHFERARVVSARRVAGDRSTVRVEMYCEEVSLRIPPAGAGLPVPSGAPRPLPATSIEQP